MTLETLGYKECNMKVDFSKEDLQNLALAVRNQNRVAPSDELQALFKKIIRLAK